MDRTDPRDPSSATNDQPPKSPGSAGADGWSAFDGGVVELADGSVGDAAVDFADGGIGGVVDDGNGGGLTSGASGPCPLGFA
jgi:hypothetical protein